MKKMMPILGLLFLAGCAGQDYQTADTGASLNAGFNPRGAPEPSAKNAELAPKALNAPATMAGPADFNNNPVNPRVTTTFQGPIPTNDWWSSLIWPFYPGNNFGENLFAHPMVFKAFSSGLAISYPTQLQVTGDGLNYNYYFQEDLRVGSANLAASDVKVADHSDWTVTTEWGPTFRSTIGHGLPFAYFKLSNAQVRTTGAVQSFYDQNGTLGVTLNGHHYGLFAPSGTRWVRSGALYNNDLSGKDYLSVALLPDNKPATLERYRQSAFTFVTGGKVGWNVTNGQLKTTYSLTTELKEGLAGKPLMALYRHQWLHSAGPYTGDTYQSPRGEMKVVAANSFETSMNYTGVLPNLPDTGKADQAKLRALVDKVYQEQLPRPLPNKDVYFAGKDLTRLAALVPIAEQVQHGAARDLFLQRIRERLDDYFDGNLPNAFFYNSKWTTLLAQPAGFGSDTQLNDHHFHFGYYIMAASTLARYDKAWATRNLENVEELISDAGNGDRNNGRFPFLRNFDPYAGHSWANGGQVFAGGNNQESSSESMQFATSIILWAQEMNRPALRDLGVYLYTTEAEAIWQYWFDADQKVFPANFPHPVLGIVWGAGGAYSTWWTGNPEEIHGINFLPIHGGSLYLGRRPEAMQRNYSHMLTRNGGPATTWQDILWSASVFADGQQSLDRWLAQNPVPEGGETAAHTYHWLATLAALGHQDDKVSADVACYAVLTDGSQRTYMAYNSGTQPITVHFSDGKNLIVPAGAVISSQGTPTTPTPTPTQSIGKLWLADQGQLLSSDSPLQAMVASAGGRNYDGRPNSPQVFRATGLSGSYSGGSTQFSLGLDAGRSVGAGGQVRVSYDFNGDGTYDRLETYRYFPTNDLPGYETYKATQGLQSSQGSFADMKNGTIQLEVWSAIGNGALALGPSFFEAPYQEAGPTTPTTPPTLTTTFDLYLGQVLQAAAPEPAPLALASAGGQNRDGRPQQAVTIVSDRLTGRYNGQNTRFQLRVDGGDKVATAVQARISYDFNGDGSYDRIETYRYFPNNDRPGWENYRETQGLTSVSGAWADFQNGKVQIELWSALGNGPTQVELGSGSLLQLPFLP